jgi:hypothetical protein
MPTRDDHRRQHDVEHGDLPRAIDSPAWYFGRPVRTGREWIQRRLVHRNLAGLSATRTLARSVNGIR